MSKTIPIRILGSDKPNPPRFCNVVIDGDKTTIEVKTSKNKYLSIPWEQMEMQVKAAQEKNR